MLGNSGMSRALCGRPLPSWGNQGCQRDCALPTGTAEAKAQGLWARSWLRLFETQSSALREGTELAASTCEAGIAVSVIRERSQ